MNGTKLPPLQILEADKYLHEEIKKMQPGEHTQCDLKIVFKDNTELLETITLVPEDDCIDNIIRYNIMGIVRYKAGILTQNTQEENVKYKNALLHINTNFYKKIFAGYSFYYDTTKKLSHLKCNATTKIKLKYQKLVQKETEKLEKTESTIAYYNGLLFGLTISEKNIETAITTYIEETANQEKYTYLDQYRLGLLEGIKLVSDHNPDRKETV